MWQRWNQGTSLFEKSLDNGGSWTPLPVAYTDRNNNFSTSQNVTGDISASANLGASGNLYIGGTGNISGTDYVGALESSAHVRAAAFLYDKGRGVPIGYVQASGGNAFVACTLNSTISNDFFWIGNYIFWNFGFNVTIPAICTEIAVSLPPGFYALATSSGACGYTNLPVPAIWYTTGTGGDYWLRIRLKDQNNFAAGVFDFRGQAVLRIG